MTHCVIANRTDPKRRLSTMKATKERQESSGQFTGKAVEIMALWADTNQKVLREIADLSLSTAAEGMRLSSELRASAIEAAKDELAFWTRGLSALGEWQHDPVAWAQKAMVEGVEEGRKAFARVEANSKVCVESAEKLQKTVEQTAEKIQQTLAGLASEMKGWYAPISG